jgi:hypothetical protein
MNRFRLAVLIAALCGCGSPPPKQRNQITLAIEPADESRRFPRADRLALQLVHDHVLGKEFLPGGNVAEYKWNGRTYQQFLVRAANSEAAGLLLFDFKGHLRDAKYLAHMGGYFGMDGAAPVYLFQKGVFLAGFVGLPEKDADALARQFAARLD